MTEIQKRIQDFADAVTKATGKLPAPTSPIIPAPALRRLRVQLIADELIELCAALDINLTISAGEAVVTGGEGAYDEVGAYDAELDLDYVVTGAAVMFGHDMEPGQLEVHRSNMTKFIDGHKRADGKWVKGPSYSPANLKPILEAMKK